MTPRPRPAPLLLLLISLLLPWPAQAMSDPALRFGVFAYRPDHVIRERYQPLADYLADKVGQPVLLRVMGQDDMNRALAANQLDFFLTNPSHFLLIRSERSLTGVLATLVRERSGVATESVGGVIFSAADRSDLSSLKDLAGQTIATPGFHFLGGFQAPALELRDAGVDLFRQTHLKLVGSHDRVLKAVLSGDADAGFIRTGILEQLAEDNGDLLARIRVLNRQNLPGFPYIASTRLYPEWPLAALPHVRSEVVRRVASALFALEPDHPAARAARIAGFAPPADYQSVEHLARSLRIAPYDEVPLVSWVDVFQQYRPWLLTVATLVLMLVVATLWLGKKRRELSLAQRRLRRLVQSWPQPMLVLRDDRFVDCNRAAVELLRAEGEGSLLGQRLAAFLPRDGESAEGRDTGALLARVVAGEVARGEWLFRRLDGSDVWVEMTLAPIHERGEPEPYVLCAWYDITGRKEAEQRQRMAASVFEHAREAIFITDRYGNVIDVNDAYVEITGRSRQEAVGQLPPLPLEEGAGVFTSARAQGFWSGEFSCRHRKGDNRILALTLSGVPDDRGRIRHFVGVFADITRLKAQEQKLLTLAHFDALTGLPNRVLFADRLQQNMAQARRQGYQLAVIYIDLDEFKPVNDAFGHEAGDELLKELARRMRSELREEDTLARLGGDEFAAQVVNVEHPERLHGLLERMLRVVSEPVWVANHTVEVSASIGYTLYPQGEELDGDQLLRQADQAMYRAKQEGRNRCCRFQGLADG